MENVFLPFSLLYWPDLTSQGMTDTFSKIPPVAQPPENSPSRVLYCMCERCVSPTELVRWRKPMIFVLFYRGNEMKCFCEHGPCLYSLLRAAQLLYPCLFPFVSHRNSTSSLKLRVFLCLKRNKEFSG
jgi:hypothetical protein